MVVALILGETAAFAGRAERDAALLIFIAAAVMTAVVKKEYVKTSVVFIFMLMVGFGICHNQISIYEKYDRLQYGDEDTGFVTVEGEVRQIKQNNYGYEVLLSSCDGDILMYMERMDNIRHGRRIYVSGEIIPMNEADNPGNFDEREYLYSEGIILKLDVGEYTVKGSDNDYNQIEEALYSVKNRFSAILSRICSGNEKGLISAIVLGEKEGIDSEIKELYSMNNIAHILSISGVKTLKLDIPLVLETRINWAFVPLHIAIIYILKLCLDEEIIPRCRFPCSRGYFTKCINWQKKQ